MAEGALSLPDRRKQQHKLHPENFSLESFAKSSWKDAAIRSVDWTSRSARSVEDAEYCADDHIGSYRGWINFPVGNTHGADGVAVVADYLVRDQFAFGAAVNDHHTDADVRKCGFLHED